MLASRRKVEMVVSKSLAMKTIASKAKLFALLRYLIHTFPPLLCLFLISKHFYWNLVSFRRLQLAPRSFPQKASSCWWWLGCSWHRDQVWPSCPFDHTGFSRYWSIEESYIWSHWSVRGISKSSSLQRKASARWDTREGLGDKKSHRLLQRFSSQWYGLRQNLRVFQPVPNRRRFSGNKMSS